MLLQCIVYKSVNKYIYMRTYITIIYIIIYKDECKQTYISI